MKRLLDDLKETDVAKPAPNWPRRCAKVWDFFSGKIFLLLRLLNLRFGAALKFSDFSDAEEPVTPRLRARIGGGE
jgi:hypothetical protein